MKVFMTFVVLFSFQAQAYEVRVRVYDTMKKMLGEVKPVVENKTEEKNEKTRQLAQTAEAPEENVLVYHSPDSRASQKTYVVDVAKWSNFRAQGNARLDLLLKLYYANIKDVSNSGQRHVGCFMGDAERLVQNYFNSELPITNVQKMYVTISEDAKMIGFEFDYKNPSVRNAQTTTGHFRLPHCIQGTKSPLIEMAQIRNAKRDMPEPSRMVASTKELRLPASLDGENGFEIYDKLNARDATAESTRSLPRFQLRADYDKISAGPNSRPWRGMDISTEEGGRKFAHFVLDYFWDSLIQDRANADNNMIAQSIPADKPKWCHMPWLNVGDSGRELIHGLTKERDLEVSEIYPEAASTPEKQGSNWGIGFYNDIACETAYKVFGHANSPLERPDFTKSQFPDGSVSVKVLFTTAPLDALQGAFTWTANVSLPKSTSRRLRPVKMIQIDIAVKDSTLKGIRGEADNWMMTTFYYDASYVAPSRHNFTGVLAGLSKMRPIGIQTGFDPSTSLIFKDAKTNSANNAHHGVRPMLLNGPADNPKASCLSCHGAAGTSVRMVPGVRDFDDYRRVKATALDFSQQLALAKRNHETRSGQKAKGWGN